MGSKGTTFLRDKTGHQVGLTFNEQLSGLIDRNLFLKNSLANADSAVIGVLSHVRRKVSSLGFVNFDEFVGVIQNQSFADHLVFGKVIKFVLTIFVAFEDKVRLPSLLFFLQDELSCKRLSKAIFESLDWADAARIDKVCCFLLGQLVTGDMLLDFESTISYFSTLLQEMAVFEMQICKI